MVQPAAKPPLLQEKPKAFSFDARLKEIDMFFEARSKQHKTLRRLVQNLEKAGIAYALVGGMAVNAHRHRRTTEDVDVLLTAEGFAEFQRRFVPRSYDRAGRHPRRFLDRQHQVTFDILVTGHFPGRGGPGPIAFPDPAEVGETIQNMQVVNLPTLIQLKLAAGRHYDFGDVVHLIRVHNLDESYLTHLHPSVHRDFIECLEEKRRDDEYEARCDERLEQMLKESEPKKYGRRRGNEQ